MVFKNKVSLFKVLNWQERKCNRKAQNFILVFPTCSPKNLCYTHLKILCV